MLRQQFHLNFDNHGNIRKLYISDISRHFTITSLSMKYISRKIHFPNFSNLDFLHIFHLFIHNLKLTNIRTFFKVSCWSDVSL